jgi:hypothetical protein
VEPVAAKKNSQRASMISTALYGRKMKKRHMLIATAVALIALTNATFSDTFSCQINRTTGFTKSIPKQIEIKSQKNSRKVLIRDNVSSEIGNDIVSGREDGVRSRFRRFTWELRPVPDEFLPAKVRTGGRKLILYAATVDHGTNAIKIRATFVQGTAAPVFGDKHEGTGKCRLSS